MAILRFFSAAGVRPEMVESEAFVEFVRELRNAPKNYVLPILIDAPTHGGISLDGLGMAPPVGAQGGMHPLGSNSSSLPVADFAMMHRDRQGAHHLEEDEDEEQDDSDSSDEEEEEQSRSTLPQMQ
jgi:hypothetical protein